jgi:hypothetical protein
MKPIKCKFCKKDVLLEEFRMRVYELDGKSYHSPNCPRRQSHFKNEREIRTEQRRQEKPR